MINSKVTFVPKVRDRILQTLGEWSDIICSLLKSNKKRKNPGSLFFLLEDLNYFRTNFLSSMVIIIFYVFTRESDL